MQDAFPRANLRCWAARHAHGIVVGVVPRAGIVPSQMQDVAVPWPIDGVGGRSKGARESCWQCGMPDSQPHGPPPVGDAHCVFYVLKRP